MIDGMRLAFDVDDLAGTRFAISPLRHALFAALCVHHPSLGAPGSIWRDVAAALPSRATPLLDLLGRAGAKAHLYGRLLWVEAPMPDTGRLTLGDELDAITALGEREFGGELWRLLLPDTPLDHDQVIGVLADGLHVIFHRFLAPEWQAMRRCLEADLARRTEAALRDGFGPMLGSLSPRLAWADHGLQISGAPAADVPLRGNGLVVGPIVSAARDYLSIAISPDRRRSLLSYPVPGARSAPAPRGRLDTLAALVGPSRARALRAIGDGCGTDELAIRLGVSPSTASEHASTLRNAGLLRTDRDGRAVRHTLTSLGGHLLDYNRWAAVGWR